MADDFHHFHLMDYLTLTRAGVANFNIFATSIHTFLDQFQWKKFKIFYEQKGIYDSEDFCKLMSSSIYYTNSSMRMRKDYYKLDDLGVLENIMISEIGIGYGGM